MHFGNSVFFIFLIIIPVIILLMYLSAKKRMRLLSRFLSSKMQKKLLLNISHISRSFKDVLLIIVLVLLIFAAARPQWGRKLQIFEEKGLDIIVAIDVSKSMLAEDLSPNRIQRAKNAFITFLHQLSGDRVGLVLFAGDSFIQCPLTSDYSALEMFASVIDVGIIPHEGTDIASAIDKSIPLFSKETQNKVIVLITDGENLQGDFKSKIKEAKDHNIIIYTIGVGTQKGAPIPIQTESHAKKVYLKNKDNNIVLSKLDASNLEMIAQKTGGLFFQVSAGEGEIKEILSDINKLEEEKISTKKFSQYKEQYRYFVFIALILLMIEFFVLERKKS